MGEWQKCDSHWPSSFLIQCANHFYVYYPINVISHPHSRWVTGLNRVVASSMAPPTGLFCPTLLRSGNTSLLPKFVWSSPYFKGSGSIVGFNGLTCCLAKMTHPLFGKCVLSNHYMPGETQDQTIKEITTQTNLSHYRSWLVPSRK